jgi:hypothetical protein
MRGSRDVLGRLVSSAVVFFTVACATPPKPPPPKPRVPPPSARSSIAAVLQHRGELDLTDEQVERLDQMDTTLDHQNQTLRDQLAKAAAPTKSDTSDSGNERAGMGMKGGGRKRGGGGATPSAADPRAAVQDQIDDNDTKAYLDAEAVLTEAQRPRAREIASAYREALYEQRHPSQTP